ncbi:RE1-silencing transcription factor [Dunckerocampus dactyliophorus]|uniref:RE1-silencing transcription factor n=1 Tax=Dunckerocampus dactyliophorus TaxID=161453 RepID=UPI002405F431|nr:RE1-silencing transcription factor [Dunckerocampus dactyliophorus]XP_054649058.1 RE1-silencing transcription factor [Dunckerocampus dactyliophorus]XP_054649059.1 RE1-silencing transcription factor [Dunckerocampus dactyliophorus]
MDTPSMFSMETFPIGVSLMDNDQSLSDVAKNSAAPQLVMLANVAAVAAADGCGEGSVADEKEMMELKTVGCGYSDSEDEGVIRYTYDNQNHSEACTMDYSESVGLCPVQAQNDGQEDKDKAEDLSQNLGGPTALPDPKPKDGAPRRVPPEGVKKKKPFHCKPCHFQAHNEKEFVEHLRTHAVSKMMVVNRVEGRSKAQEAETAQGQAPSCEEGKEASGASADSKGLIRCERCGYNTNRYDHYVAHLKHHSKEGDDHRVFKCTLCAYSTVSQYHWRKHLRNHFPSKLHTCTQCSYFSDRKSNYIQHIRTHTGVRPFQCPYCDYSSSQKTHLTRHKRTHSGERPFKCESCNYLAANQHEVTRHARQVHNGPKPLACPYCEYKTADRSNFKKHVELHLNPRQFLCPLCEYAASKKCNLQYHIKSRHAGCDVTVDVSKVKLRVKKHPSGVEEPPKTGKTANLSSVEEDLEAEESAPSEKPSDPINLSIRKRGKPGQSEDPEELPRKCNGNAEKVAKTNKLEQEKTITTRQKKMKENNEDLKGKKRVKKMAADVPDPQPTKGERKKCEVGGAASHQGGNESSKPRRPAGKTSKREEPNESLNTPEPLEKNVQENNKKRKVAEALDLSSKSSYVPPSKVRRVRPGNKWLSAPACKDTAEESDAVDAPHESTLPAKRTRRSTRITSVCGQKDQSSTPEAPECSAHLDESTPTPQCDTPSQVNTPLDEPPLAKPASPPAVALPAPQGKAADPEDDEGVHSSHEGASDISDSASEGSVDSGLNSNSVNSGKMPNDPETPTEEIPTPTELKSHMCIFCDRHFPLEVEYRRHLNRHLVNVYYMDAVHGPK